MKAVILIFTILFIAKVSFAAGGEHSGEIPFVVVYQAINFTLLVILLFTLTRKKIVNYFTQRVEKHEKDKKEAIRAFEEAQQKLEVVQEKLQTLNAQEGDAIRRAQEEARTLKSKLIHEAEELAKAIVEDAKKTASYELEKAKAQLRDEVFSEALSTSRNSMKTGMTKEDQKSLQKQFIESVGV